MEKFRSDAAVLIEKIEAGDFTLSPSSFRAFCQSPAHFIHYRCMRRDTDTQATIEGSLTHSLILQPDKTWDEYILKPDNLQTPASAQQTKFADAIFRAEKAGEEIDLAALYASLYKVGKTDDPAALAAELKGKLAEYIAYLHKADGKKEITVEMLQTAELLRDAVMNSAAGKFFDPADINAESEKAITWEYGGLGWRGYIDRIHYTGNGVILDVKKTTDASEKKLGWTIRDMDYDIQVELYRGGVGMPDARGIIVAVEPPFHVNNMEIHPVALRNARRRIDYYLAKFKDCIMSGAWWESYGYYARDYEDYESLFNGKSFIFR